MATINSINNTSGTLVVTSETPDGSSIFGGSSNSVAQTIVLTANDSLTGVNGDRVFLEANKHNTSNFIELSYNTGGSSITIANATSGNDQIIFHNNLSNVMTIGDGAGNPGGVSFLGIITAGTWQGNPITGAYGGTGVNNGASTITIGGNVAFSGASTFTGTLTGNTSVTFPTSGTLATTATTVSSVSGTANRITSTGGTTPVIDISAAYVGQTSITTLGTISSGTWQGAVIGGTYGGTGVNNGASTITIGGNVTFSGAHTFSGTLTGNTAVTFPTSGTLSTSTGTVTSITQGTNMSFSTSPITTTGTINLASTVSGLTSLSTAALTAAGTVNLNITGSGVTTIGTGGTGAVDIGNATGNTAVTGNLNILSPGIFEIHGIKQWPPYVNKPGQATIETSAWISSTPPLGGVVGICWAPQLNLFVGVNNVPSTTAVMTSPDGLTWTSQTVANSISWNSICWSPDLGLLCAVGNAGTNGIMTSPDSITWTFHNAPTSTNWRSVCWSPELGLFCAVSNLSASTSNIITSPDGATWTTQTISTAAIWNGVCWSSELGLFVAVGNNVVANGSIWSRDGINWTFTSTVNAEPWQGVCWAPEIGKFIAVDNSNHVITSSNPTSSWTAITLGSNISPQGIGYSSYWSESNNNVGIILIVGNSTSIYTSTDAVTFTLTSSALANNDAFSVCWSPDIGRFCVSSGNTLVYLSAIGPTETFGNVTVAGTLGALTQVGTANINNTGSATTNIAASGTGTVNLGTGSGATNIGNATGNVDMTGNINVTGQLITTGIIGTSTPRNSTWYNTSGWVLGSGASNEAATLGAGVLVNPSNLSGFVSYTQNSSTGDVWIINITGIYSIVVNSNYSGSSPNITFCLDRNSPNTQSYSSDTFAQMLVWQGKNAGQFELSLTWVGLLNATDSVRFKPGTGMITSELGFLQMCFIMAQ